MLSLFILILFGIGVAFFAGQNMQATSVVFGQYGLQNVPLYAVVLGAILFGIFVSWIISLVGFVSNSLTLRGKEGRIRDAETHVHKLEERVHKLELENERLRGEEHVEKHVTSEPVEKRPLNPFVKIRQRFS